jgi:hypothetical protein
MLLAVPQVKMIYAQKPTPSFFRCYDPGSLTPEGSPELLIDIAYSIEPLHSSSPDSKGSVDFQDKEWVCRTGDVSSGIYIIARGRAEIIDWDPARDEYNQVEEDWRLVRKLRVSDCFGERATLGLGRGDAGRQMTMSVRARAVPADQSVDSETSPRQIDGQEMFLPRLNYLSLEKLKRLYEKHPRLQPTLMMQARLLKCKGERKERERRLRQNAQWPKTQQAAFDVFEGLLETTTVSGAEGRRISYDDVSHWLKSVADTLPVDPKLPSSKRRELIREIFDQDQSGLVDKDEFWAGVQQVEDRAALAKRYTDKRHDHEFFTIDAKVDKVATDVAKLVAAMEAMSARNGHGASGV